MKILNRNNKDFKMTIFKYKIIILGMVLLPNVVFASVMSSESYQMGANIIGPGVINIATSTNYITEYSPGENYIYGTPTTETTEETTIGGGGIIDGSVGGKIPDHINAFNVPLIITEKQSGTLSYNFPDGLVIVVDVPRQITPKGITIIVKAEKESISNEYLIPPESYLIGNIFWNITAVDFRGESVKQFDEYITITLKIPDMLIGVKDLGVYWLDEDAVRWMLIPDAVFDETKVTFNVNHLTKFSIFGRKDILDGLDVLNPIELPGFFEVLMPNEPVEVIKIKEVDLVKPNGSGRIERLTTDDTQVVEPKENSKFFILAFFFILIITWYLIYKRKRSNNY